MQNAAQAYLKTKISTTSQGHIVLMLYDGAITSLGRAKEKIAVKDYAQKGILISKAMDIIAELDCSLNGQKGGELAQNLHSLYFYCSTRLLTANLNMDLVIVDEVISILSQLRSAFAAISGSESLPSSPPQHKEFRRTEG
jgi:flagellar secretion chaperone FliS